MNRQRPGDAGPARVAAPSGAAAPAHPEALPDITAPRARRELGVTSALHPRVLADLVDATAARVAVGRAGTRPRTGAMIRFLADHARAKDTVLKDFPDRWVEQTGFVQLRTQIVEKNQYLTRPDLGRRLSQESVRLALAQCRLRPQVQLIVSEGLSTDAIVANFDEIVPPLQKGLANAGLQLGTPVFVRHGRVKVEDHLGELLEAQVVILLIGERPGLGQSESLSCYMVYSPRVDTTVESDRLCVSNIHAGGTPPVEAAAVIVDLACSFLRNRGKPARGPSP